MRVGDPNENLRSPVNSLGLWWKALVLQGKFEISSEKDGYSNKNLGYLMKNFRVSDEKLVSNEKLGVYEDKLGAL